MLTSFTSSSLTSFTPPLTLIRYFQLYLTEVNEVRWFVNIFWGQFTEVESSRTSLASRTSSEHILKSLSLASKVKSLTLASKPQVLGNYPWNFIGKRQKPRGKFANTFFCFRLLEHRRSQGGGPRGPAHHQLKFHQWQKCDKKLYCFFSFSFFLAFFACNSN